MPKSGLAATPIVLSMLVFAVSASAETLRCRSVNGNVTCAGSGAVNCQTINGRTVCVGGRGDAVQSFGGNAADPDAAKWPRSHNATEPSIDHLGIEEE